jgi:hypothetical protein
VVGYVVLVDRTQWKSLSRLMPTVAAAVALFILWEAAFYFGVSHVFKMPPVRSPFLMGKLVSTLGEPGLAKVCASKHFVVCKYQDRLPIDVDGFIWAEDERKGVFGAADLPTKQALCAEQLRFALAVLRTSPGPLVAALSRDALRQLVDINLDEFFYEESGHTFFRDRLPGGEYRTLLSTVAARSRVYVVLGRSALLGATTLSAILLAFLLSGVMRPGDAGAANEFGQVKNWRAITGILLSGVVLNAIICGDLSSVNPRYEARVIWLIQLSLVTGIYVTRPDWKFASLFERNLSERMAVSNLLPEEKGAQDRLG